MRKTVKKKTVKKKTARKRAAPKPVDITNRDIRMDLGTMYNAFNSRLDKVVERNNALDVLVRKQQGAIDRIPEQFGGSASVTRDQACQVKSAIQSCANQSAEMMRGIGKNQEVIMSSMNQLLRIYIAQAERKPWLTRTWKWITGPIK